ncbi:MAG: glycine cleavage T C-terminal barrel domain-containing protein [Coriobacteriales bacterium]|jgi:aminomethyltransferase
MLFREDEVARAEVKAVRTNAAWYRWTHDIVELKGLDAERFLDHMLVNRMARLAVGHGRYTTMLDEEGGIIDDLVAFRKTEGTWWLSTLYGPQMLRWFDSHKEGYDVSYVDITGDWDMYAIQGPNSPKIMKTLVKDDVDNLKRFQMVETKVGDIDVAVDRGGFTGEMGFELYCRRTDSPAIEKAIAAAADKQDAPRLTVLEVYVRSIPMEKGIGLRQDYHNLTPYEAGLGWSVHDDKDFVGKEALERRHSEGEKYAFVGFEFEPDRESYEDIAQNEIVYKRGIPVGRVRQMIYGYTVEKNIGIGFVDAEKCPIGTKVTLGCSHHAPAVVVEPRWV